MEAIILVDYYNLTRDVQRRGIIYILDRLVELVLKSMVVSEYNILVRIYGGWIEGARLTRRAQELVAEIDSIVPKLRRYDMPSGKVSVRYRIELAQALAGEENSILQHTFRSRQIQDGIYVNPELLSSCGMQGCPAALTHNVLSRKACTMAGCNVSAREMFWRDEQKMVDSMIVSDMIFFGIQKKDIILVVSSDDDMVPGIRTALMVSGNSTQVIRVFTKSGKAENDFYRHGLEARYLTETF